MSIAHLPEKTLTWCNAVGQWYRTGGEAVNRTEGGAAELPQRDAALALLREFTTKPGLLKHALAVEAALRAYARKSGAENVALHVSQDLVDGNQVTLRFGLRSARRRPWFTMPGLGGDEEEMPAVLRRRSAEKAGLRGRIERAVVHDH